MKHVAEQGKRACSPLPAGWLTMLLHQLKQHGLDCVLAHLEQLSSSPASLENNSVGQAQRRNRHLRRRDDFFCFFPFAR